MQVRVSHFYTSVCIWIRNIILHTNLGWEVGLPHFRGCHLHHQKCSHSFSFHFFFSSYRFGVSHCRAWVIKGFTAHSNCLRRGTLHGPNSSGECWTDKQGGRAAGRHGGRWAAPMWLCGAGCWSGFHMQTHLPATPVFAVIDAKHTGSLLLTCLAFSFPLYLSPLLLALLISSPLLTHPFLHSTLSFLNRFLCNFSIPLFLLLLPLHWRDPCKKFCTFLYGEKPVNIPLANQEKRH